MIVQGHHTPAPAPTTRQHPPGHPGGGGTPTKPEKPSHPSKPQKPSKPSKPTPQKPSKPAKPSKPEHPGKKTAGREEFDFELEWVEFRPLAKGGYIH